MDITASEYCNRECPEKVIGGWEECECDRGSYKEEYKSLLFFFLCLMVLIVDGVPIGN